MMVIAGHFLVFAVVNFVVCLSLQLCSAATTPYFQRENEQPATVKVKVADTDARQRRSLDQFPDQLDIDLSTDEIQENFRHLKRNFHVPDIKYVHMMENGAVKKFKFESKEKYAYYIDVEHGVALRVSLKSEGSEEFDIYGTFVSEQIEYLVQPPKDNQSTYKVSKMLEKRPTLFDYVNFSNTDAKIIEEKPQKRSQQTTMTGREKRQTTDYEVEIFFVHDYAMYNSWYATTEGESDRHNATVDSIIQFTSFLLNAIDLRYQTVTDYSYTISCLFAGIYIASVSSDAPFAENSVDSNNLVAETALAAFKEWGEDSLRDFNYDHAMLFTAYDLGRVSGGVFNNATAGRAYLPSYYTNGDMYAAAVCGPLRYSINEGGDIIEGTNFNPTTATVAAHELGHNLGASHDGSSCSGGYVMDSTYSVSSVPSENLQLWQFSSCSQTYFDTYITNLNDASLNCMTVRTATGNDDLDPYVNDLAGQAYSPDAQCENMRGTGSFLYRSYYNGDYSAICTILACASTTSSGAAFAYIAWEGTTCGNGKICQSGSCVESSLAPQVNDETCAFGDVPYNVPFQTSGCSDFIGTQGTSYNCYQETYLESCCETCEAFRQNTTTYSDCEYGDKASWCSGLLLSGCRLNNATCCKTCEDLKQDTTSIPATSTTTSPTTTSASTAIMTTTPTTTTTTTSATTITSTTTTSSTPMTDFTTLTTPTLDDKSNTPGLLSVYGYFQSILQILIFKMIL